MGEQNKMLEPSFLWFAASTLFRGLCKRPAFPYLYCFEPEDARRNCEYEHQKDERAREDPVQEEDTGDQETCYKQCVEHLTRKKQPPRSHKEAQNPHSDDLGNGEAAQRIFLNEPALQELVEVI